VKFKELPVLLLWCFFALVIPTQAFGGTPPWIVTFCQRWIARAGHTVSAAAQPLEVLKDSRNFPVSSPWAYELSNQRGPKSEVEFATVRVDLEIYTIDDLWNFLESLDYQQQTARGWEVTAVRGNWLPIRFQRLDNGYFSLLFRGVRAQDYADLVLQLEEIWEAYAQLDLGTEIKFEVYGRGNLREPQLVRNYLALLTRFREYLAGAIDWNINLYDGPLANWDSWLDHTSTIEEVDEQLELSGLDQVIGPQGSIISYSRVNGERRAMFHYQGESVGEAFEHLTVSLGMAFQALTGVALEYE